MTNRRDHIVIGTKDYDVSRSVSIHSNFVSGLVRTLQFAPLVISSGGVPSPALERERIVRARKMLPSTVGSSVDERSPLMDILRLLESFGILNAVARNLQSSRLIHWFEHYGLVHTALRTMYPRVSNCITLFSYLKRYRAYDSLLKLSLNSFDRIVTTTNEFRQILVAVGIDPAKISVIPLGVDLEYFCPARNMATEKAKLRIGKETRVVSWFGQITPSTEEDTLQMLKIAGEAYSSNRSLRFLLCFKNLPEHIAKLQVPGTTIFARVDVRSILWASDLMVLPFTSTTHFAVQPLTAVEALACGVPVVFLRNRSLEELVLDGVNGFIASSVNEIPRRILDGLEEAETLSEMRRNARRMAEEKFDITKIANSYANLWNELGRGYDHLKT